MKNISKIISGFSFIDEKWGGIYPGGNYLVFGPIKSGKSIFALNLVEYFSNSGVSVLYLTSERDKTIEIQTSSLLFDINEPIEKGFLSIQKLDNSFSDYAKIKNIILEKNPVILIIDEIINRDLREISSRYNDFISFLEKLNITSFFISSIPKNENLKSFLKHIVRCSTGIVYLKKNIRRKDISGTLTIRPNIGHFEGEFQTSYKLMPGRGIVTEPQEITTESNRITDEDSKSVSKNNFEYTNLYNVDEFDILIESKKTFIGKSEFLQYIIIYELVNKDFDIEQVTRRVGEILDIADKYCENKNRILIMPDNSDLDLIENLTGKIDNSLKSYFKTEDNLSNFMKKNIQILKSNFTIN